MSNPTIHFRLSPYQIARGLYIVRQALPTYKPTSCSQLIKMLYLDYLAKMSYHRSDLIPPELVLEVKQMLEPGIKQMLTLDDLVGNDSKKIISNPDDNKEEKSKISTANDLSPSPEWLLSLGDE